MTIHWRTAAALGGLALCSCGPQITDSHVQLGVKGDHVELRLDAPFTFATGSELPNLPNTWYCVDPWSTDKAAERQGMVMFAWRLFLAIQWPGKDLSDPGPAEWSPFDATGAPYSLARLNQAGFYPRWNSWPTMESLFLELQGRTSSQDDLSWTCEGGCLKNHLDGPGFDEHASNASSNEVFDRNGVPLLLETRVDASWQVNIKSALESANEPPPPGVPAVDFQHGQCQGRGPDGGDSKHWGGAVAIKLAWKVLSSDEVESRRFLMRSARRKSPCPAGAESCDVELGLVGFHIAQKSNSYSKWIWSTFEHVDNLVGGDGRPATFRDEGCKTCCDNASQTSGGKCKTQISRTEPIAEDVRRANDLVHTWLKGDPGGGTVLQYYELIGVQYTPFGTVGPQPEALRNSVIETFQAGKGAPSCAATDVCGSVATAESSSCMGCHETAKSQDFMFVPANYLCSCKKDGPWLGDKKCANLGIPRSSCCSCKKDGPWLGDKECADLGVSRATCPPR